MQYPTVAMLYEVDRCLRYFISTAEDGITFDGSRGGRLIAFSDSD